MSVRKKEGKEGEERKVNRDDIWRCTKVERAEMLDGGGGGGVVGGLVRGLEHERLREVTWEERDEERVDRVLAIV